MPHMPLFGFDPPFTIAIVYTVQLQKDSENFPTLDISISTVQSAVVVMELR
jgi:hypothetical protein